MQVLKMEIDNMFNPNDTCKKPMEKLRDVYVVLSEVKVMSPFEKCGVPFFSVVMNSGRTYHATCNLRIVQVKS